MDCDDDDGECESSEEVCLNRPGPYTDFIVPTLSSTVPVSCWYAVQYAGKNLV